MWVIIPQRENVYVSKITNICMESTLWKEVPCLEVWPTLCLVMGSHMYHMYHGVPGSLRSWSPLFGSWAHCGHASLHRFTSVLFNSHINPVWNLLHLVRRCQGRTIGCTFLLYSATPPDCRSTLILCVGTSSWSSRIRHQVGVPSLWRS